MEPDGLRRTLERADRARLAFKDAAAEASAALGPVLDFWARIGGDDPCTRACSWEYFTTYQHGIGPRHDCYHPEPYEGDPPVPRILVLPWHILDDYAVQGRM